MIVLGFMFYVYPEIYLFYMHQGFVFHLILNPFIFLIQLKDLQSQKVF